MYALDLATGCQGRHEYGYRRLYDSHLYSLEKSHQVDFFEAGRDLLSECADGFSGSFERELVGSYEEIDFEEKDSKMFKSFLLLTVTVSTTVVSVYLMG
jgi:hypothetical protein